jgi:hypothetical protein
MKKLSLMIAALTILIGTAFSQENKTQDNKIAKKEEKKEVKRTPAPKRDAKKPEKASAKEEKKEEKKEVKATETKPQ